MIAEDLARDQSARGLAHSKTLRAVLGLIAGVGLGVLFVMQAVRFGLFIGHLR
jgi:hypothetical protein